jgi:hypothetical protein
MITEYGHALVTKQINEAKKVTYGAIKCSICNEVFVKESSGHKYCSKECAAKAEKIIKQSKNSGLGKSWSLGNKKEPKLSCAVCSALFHAPLCITKRHGGNGGKYCSRKCYGLSKTKNICERTCKKCRAKFFIDKGQSKSVCPSCITVKPEITYTPCAWCSKPKDSNIKFCNVICYQAKRKSEIKPHVLKPNSICLKCGGDFYSSPGHRKSGWGKYCSIGCRPLGKYSRGKGGTREDLGIYVRSSWEANYARYLNWLVSNKQIKCWEYEPKTFEFPVKRGTRFYTPDFLVTENNGVQAFYEVKGWMDAKSATQIKRMGLYHPEVKLHLIQNKEMRELNRKVGGLIPHWERNSNDKL